MGHHCAGHATRVILNGVKDLGRRPRPFEGAEILHLRAQHDTISEGEIMRMGVGVIIGIIIGIVLVLWILAKVLSGIF
jgi:hypothetical protein